MAVKFNPATGQTEDDGASSTPGLYDQVASTVSTIFPPAGLAMQIAPAVLEEGTPPAPDPLPAPAPSVSPSPAAPAPAPAAAPAIEPAKPAEPTLTKESSTTTKSTTGTVVSPEMRAADKEVASADAQGEKALALEAANRTKQAEIDQAKLDVEATLAKQRAKNAAAAEVEANRRKAEIDAKAKADQDAYQGAAAAGDKGFWGSQNTPSRIAWGLSMLFGGAAHGAGAENNPGAQLLDKTMADWTAERDKKLARLEREAAKSSGLQRTFWQDYGAEYKARKELQDAAAYTTVADKIDAMNEKMKTLLPAQALATNAAKAADYRQRAAEKRQAVVDQRASKFTQTTTDVDTTTTGLTPAQAAQADKARAETLLDLNGNVVGRALSKEEGEKIRAGQAATNSLTDVLAKLRAFNQAKGTTPGSAVLGKVGIETTDFKNRDTLMTQAAGYMTKMYETGVLNEGEYRRYVAILKPSLFQGAKGANESLDLITEGSVNGYNRRLGSQAVKPAASAPGGAAPSARPPGAVEGTYKGHRGYRVGNQFFATE